MTGFGTNNGPWELGGLEPLGSRMRETPPSAERLAAREDSRRGRGEINRRLQEGLDPYPAINAMAATEFTPARMMERAQGILNRAPKDEGDGLFRKTYESVLKTFEQTQLFIANGIDEDTHTRVNGSLLAWEQSGGTWNIVVHRDVLEKQLKLLDRNGGRSNEFWAILNEFRGLNVKENMLSYRSVAERDPDYAARYAQEFCRDPESVKGAAKTTLALVLAGIVLLNVFRAKNGGMPLFITLAGIGGIYLLMRSDKKYAMLQSPEFLGAIQSFESPDAVRKFADQYFAMTSKQKRALKKQVTLRFDASLGNKNAQVTLEALTEPKDKQGEIDDLKAVDPEVARRFMAMDPQTAYSFLIGLEQVKTGDRDAFAETLAALRNPATRPDASAALAGAIPVQPAGVPPQGAPGL